MQPAALTPPPQAFPLQELEQIERAIAAAQNCVATLQLRRELLTSELERITRPAPPAPKIIGPGFRYSGEMVRAWSAIDIHAGLLRRLWTEFPERRDAMARAMGARGYSRAYVARTPEELFPGKPAAWAAKFSRRASSTCPAEQTAPLPRASANEAPISPIPQMKIFTVFPV